MEKTIIDLVEEDDDLRAALQALVEAKYLLPGVFDPRAYLLDDARIRSKWKNRRRRALTPVDWTAIGVAIHNQFLAEVYANFQTGEEPRPEQKTSDWLEAWERDVAEALPEEDTILNVAQKLGQYLEFRNRKSQGF